MYLLDCVSIVFIGLYDLYAFSAAMITYALIRTHAQEAANLRSAVRIRLQTAAERAATKRFRFMRYNLD